MPPLAPGAVGDDVTSLQLALVAIGLLGGEPTGAYDAVTRQAVLELQRRARLPQTGAMDDATWDALFRIQAEVAPTTGGEVSADPRPQGTTELEPVSIVGAHSRGTLFFIFAAVAGATYWFNKRKQQYAGDDEGEDDDDGEDIDFIPPSHRKKSTSRSRQQLEDLDDAVTDSLIDEPAVVASSGRPGDCKKAARMLLSRSGLAQTSSERGLYNRVVKKVASDCRGAEDAVAEAIEEEQGRREEIEEVLGARGVRSHEDVERHPGEGFRKTKTKLTKKTTTSKRRSWKPELVEEIEEVAHAHRPGRRGAAAIGVRKKSGETYRIRKEKAKTKRGYTWRKET